MRSGLLDNFISWARSAERDRRADGSVALAAAGFLNPLAAAFIQIASEMAFILNSARLLPPRASTHEPGALDQLAPE